MTPTPLSPEPRRVRIAASGPTARLEINGRDVADQVREYQLRHLAGQLPELSVLLRPTAGADWDGLARVAVGEEPDPGPAAAQFLAALDAGEVQRAVLARHDLLDGGPAEFTRALLVQLTEWSLGKGQPGGPAEMVS
ncbi:hypothetical protein OG196_14270 [Kitasatospora purpeofusca]|uniref:hypothetical protein n=1 Tax=Kitasatospora purpeofusca TaxID=67352 RepID=UPI002E0FA9B3|nr:hypothetical protein OG196_14270 [Kitasatospora purpeofusca]